MASYDLDLCGLFAVEQGVAVLRKLAGFGPGDHLVARMDTEPVMIYAELDRRGLSWTFGWNDGVGVLTIRNAAEDDTRDGDPITRVVTTEERHSARQRVQ